MCPENLLIEKKVIVFAHWPLNLNFFLLRSLPLCADPWVAQLQSGLWTGERKQQQTYSRYTKPKYSLLFLPFFILLEFGQHISPSPLAYCHAVQHHVDKEALFLLTCTYRSLVVQCKASRHPHTSNSSPEKLFLVCLWRSNPSDDLLIRSLLFLQPIYMMSTNSDNPECRTIISSLLEK